MVPATTNQGSTCYQQASSKIGWASRISYSLISESSLGKISTRRMPRGTAWEGTGKEGMTRNVDMVPGRGTIEGRLDDPYLSQLTGQTTTQEVWAVGKFRVTCRVWLMTILQHLTQHEVVRCSSVDALLQECMTIGNCKQ